MDFEDNTKALFVEPNAYIQHYENSFPKQKETAKKIIFSEPYESVPNFYLHNEFKKVKKEEPEKNNSRGFLNFDLKNLLPILSIFTKGNSSLSGIMEILNGGKADIGEIAKTLLSNKDMISNFGNLFNKKNSTKTKTKSTDFVIDNCTKV